MYGYSEATDATGDKRVGELRAELAEVESGGSWGSRRSWLLRALHLTLADPVLDLTALSHRSAYAYTLKAFLATNGPLWTTAFQLAGNPGTTRIHLDPAIFPAHTRHIVRSVCEMEALTPVEVVALFFALHLDVCPAEQNNVDATDSLYFFLLQEFCNFFLPANGRFVSPQANFAQRESGGLGSNKLGGGGGDGPHFGTPLGLFRRCVYESGLGRSLTEGRRDGVGLGESPCAERRGGGAGERGGEVSSFVRVLCAAWLRVEGGCGLATERRILGARFLLKQLHHFVYSGAECGDWAEAELKEAILPATVSRRLLPFLSHHARHWPLDASFRPILETWLSYIQPWRYVGGGELQAGDERWRHFIQTHIEYYTHLYSLMIERLSRMELSSSRSLILAARVGKVWTARGGLVEVVEELDTFTHALPPVPRLLANIQHSIADLGETRRRLKAELRRAGVESGGGWWSRFVASLSEVDPREAQAAAALKLATELTELGRAFAEAYDLGPFRPQPDSASYDSDGQGEPDNVLDISIGRRKLTQKGRLQVRRKERSFAFDSSASSEAQLDVSQLHSYEVGPLATLGFHLSRWVNSRFGRRLESWYRSGGVEGWLGRAVLSPESRLSGFASPAIRRQPLLLPPRLNFRAALTIPNLLLALLLALAFRFLPTSAFLLSCALTLTLLLRNPHRDCQ